MTPNPSLGAEVCSWIETYLCHGPGDIQEEPIDLDDEFRAFVWRAYRSTRRITSGPAVVSTHGRS